MAHDQQERSDIHLPCGKCPVEVPQVRSAALLLAPRWGILPGRRVAHALVGTGRRVGAYCGQSKGYDGSQVDEIDSARRTRLCESCVMALVGGGSGGVLKFFLDHIPGNFRKARRARYRAWFQSVIGR